MKIKKQKVFKNNNAKKETNNIENAPRIRVRAPPRNLFMLVHGFTDNQKMAVAEMGFGSLNSYMIPDVPTQLGYWLVDNFDPVKCTLNVNGVMLKITKESIHEVLGIPCGGSEIKPLDQTTSGDQTTRLFRQQFKNQGKRIYIKDFVDHMVVQKQTDFLFQLNFLVLFVTTMGESIKCNTVNQKFLNCLHNESVINKMDWCGYILESLKTTRKEWNQSSHFNGPLVFLLLYYANAINSQGNSHNDIPVIKQFDSDSLQEIEDSEKANGAFGSLYAQRKKGKRKKVTKDLDEDATKKPKPTTTTTEISGNQSKKYNTNQEGPLTEIPKKTKEEFLKCMMEKFDLIEETKKEIGDILNRSLDVYPAEEIFQRINEKFIQNREAEDIRKETLMELQKAEEERKRRNSDDTFDETVNTDDFNDYHQEQGEGKECDAGEKNQAVSIKSPNQMTSGRTGYTKKKIQEEMMRIK